MQAETPTPSQAGAPEEGTVQLEEPAPSPRALRFGDSGKSLRSATARGTLINAAFQVSLTMLSMAKGYVVAAFLVISDYGLWGVLVAALGSLGNLKQVGIADKYVQQDEADQEAAFQKAFTLECMATAGFLVVLVALIPVAASVYRQPEIVTPALVLCAAIPATVFQVPIWVFLRRMEFVKQRSLMAVSPLTALAVTVTMAATGFGYWSLVAGTVAGAWASAIASVVVSPYKFRFRFERGTAREYLSFSWPVFVASLTIVAIAQVPVLIASNTLGLVAVGAMGLGNLVAVYSRQASEIITQTIYPAVCAIKDRRDLMFEVFTKANRLGILWAAPLGVGVTLFATDLVDFVFGDQWEPALVLLQAFGLVTVVNQFGTNWTAFYRAVGNTKPIAVAYVVNMVAVCGIAGPLLAIYELDGFAVGMAIATLIYFAFRIYYLNRLFPQFSMLHHVARATAPTVIAAAAVLAVRVTLADDHGIGLAFGELGLFVVVVVVATLFTERQLVREVIAYLRKSPVPRMATAPSV